MLLSLLEKLPLPTPISGMSVVPDVPPLTPEMDMEANVRIPSLPETTNREHPLPRTLVSVMLNPAKATVPAKVKTEEVAEKELVIVNVTLVASEDGVTSTE